MPKKEKIEQVTPKVVQSIVDQVDKLEDDFNKVKDLPKNDLAAFIAPMKDLNHFWKHALTFDVMENTENAFEVKVTECLWAKTFRNNDAADIGYACICHSDFVAAEAFNPKMKLIRTKTLMQGHDCCNHRYIMKA